MTYRALKQYHQSLEYANKCGNSVEYKINKGICNYYCGNYQKAVEIFNEHLKEKSQEYSWIKTEFDNADDGSARIISTSKYTYAYKYLALSELRLSQEDTQWEKIEQEILVSYYSDLKDIQNYICYAIYYIISRKYNEALKILDKANRIDTDNPDVYFLMSKVYDKTNRPELENEYLGLAKKYNYIYDPDWDKL